MTQPRTRREFVQTATLTVAASAVSLPRGSDARAASAMIPFMFVSEDRANAVREAITEGKPPVQPVAQFLRERADKAMPRGPWSVTYHKSPVVSGNSHDYFSEGPYWWPNPKDPNGKYLRRDGKVNPDRFEAHYKGMHALSRTVRDLSLGAFVAARAPTYRSSKARGPGLPTTSTGFAPAPTASARRRPRTTTQPTGRCRPEPTLVWSATRTSAEWSRTDTARCSSPTRSSPTAVARRKRRTPSR